jgi:hypothetical protein
MQTEPTQAKPAAQSPLTEQLLRQLPLLTLQM